MLNSRIERRGSGFVINVNGDAVPTYAYVSYQPAKARYEDFKAAGVRLFSTGVYAGDRGINQSSGLRPFRPGFFLGEDAYDFRYVDEDFRLIVGNRAPGEVYILPRLMLEMPKWWEDAHPEAWCLDAQGVSVHCSFSSDDWLSACARVMARFEVWLEESGWDRYVIGWHIAAGSTEEFVRPILHPMQYQDYSPVSARAFQVFLKDKYITVDRLNCAWRAGYASFDDVSLPSPARREYALRGDLRDGAKEAGVIDFYRFYNREVSLFAQKLVREAKRVTDGRQIMGIFYGNITLCSAEYAHNDMSLLLSDDQIDFLASPFAYTNNRAQGIHWGFQAALEAANLHCKPFFVESDIRTCLSKPISECMPFANPVSNDAYDVPVWLGPKDVAGSLGQMTRAFADVVTHSAATWWFDMWGGWYARDEFMDFHNKARRLYESAMSDPDVKPQAPVAVFLDEDALNYFASRAGYTAAELLPEQMRELGACGAPYHTYMLGDLSLVSPNDYSVALFLFPAKLTVAMKARIDKWKSNGRTVFFVLLPDYYGMGVENATGFSVTEEPGVVQTRGIYRDTPYPSRALTLPNITIRPEEDDIVLANTEDGRPCAVLRREDTHQVLWSIAPCVPADMLREVILLSRGHVFNYTGEIISANNRYVAIHSSSEGVKRLFLPRKGALKDVFTGEILEGNETYTDIRMAFGETRMFEMLFADIPRLPR